MITLKNKSISWKLECSNCGFGYSVIFDADESEENKKELRSCPCGCEMEIIKEDVYGKAE